MKKILILTLFVGLFAVAHATSSPKIYVQWAQSNISDWSLLSVSTWANQPTKADPTGDTTSLTGIGDSLLDNQKGWIFGVNVQGVTFTYYDHYAVEGTVDSVKITAWRDDSLLFPVGQRQADVATINALKFDAKVGQDNTDQSFVFYREGVQYNPSDPRQRPYSEFVPPDPSIVKPGVYVSDAKYQQFIDAETLKGWR